MYFSLAVPKFGISKWCKIDNFNWHKFNKERKGFLKEEKITKLWQHGLSGDWWLSKTVKMLPNILWRENKIGIVPSFWKFSADLLTRSRFLRGRFFCKNYWMHYCRSKDACIKNDNTIIFKIVYFFKTDTAAILTRCDRSWLSFKWLRSSDLVIDLAKVSAHSVNTLWQ